MKKNKLELILEVGAAGGTISLWSINTKDSAPSFIITTDESTLREFMDDDDAKGISFKRKSALLHSFSDALVALEKYPWYNLKLLFVHQDYIDPILAAAKKLGAKQKDNFMRRLNLKFINELNSKNTNQTKF
jgi:hypothetical protein